MIEPTLRRGMQSVSLRLQVHPKLERFRARVPYFVVTALITCLLLVPAIGIVLLAQALGYRGTQDVSLTRTWLTIAALPPGVAAVFALMAGIGWASGYRPFRARWESPTRDAKGLVELATRLMQAAQAEGFVTVWRGRDGAQFVAVRDIAMEMNRTFNSGSKFPMRLSLLRTGGGVEMKLANRTVVLWDTGERAACERAGQAILANAQTETTPGVTSTSPLPLHS